MYDINRVIQSIQDLNDEDMPRLLMHSTGAVALIMSPEYQAAVMTDEGETTVIIDRDTLMEIAMGSMSQALGFDIREAVQGISDDTRADVVEQARAHAGRDRSAEN